MAVRLSLVITMTSCGAILVAQQASTSMLAARHGRHFDVRMMAGFGAPAAKGSKGSKKGSKTSKKGVGKTAELSPKRQWDKFKELVSVGAERHAVFAQLDDKWTVVGSVAVASPGTAAQAAQFNKRLILEHAPRVNPALQLRAKELVCGLAGADGEPEALTKQEVATSLECGFEGAPDATGKYASVRGTTMKSDPTAILGSAARG